jgi:ribonuclease III
MRTRNHREIAEMGTLNHATLIAIVAGVAGLAALVGTALARRRARPVEGLDPLFARALSELQARLGHRFGDPRHIVTAMTHSSFANEAGPEAAHNETMEFLGDAVIELVTSTILIRLPGDLREGEMSKVRAMVVNKTSLAEMARDLRLGDALRMSRGEQSSGGAQKQSLLANAYEALVAAVFLDGGYDAARRIFEAAFERRIADAMGGRLRSQDFKTRLQEVCQARFGSPPSYRIVEEHGPDHAKVFVTELRIRGTSWGTGRGTSKKEAEQDAARAALARLEREDFGHD